MKAQDGIDAHFITMCNLIASKHNAKIEIDADNRTVNFLTDNVSQQCIDDLEVLFDKYAC